MNRPDRKRAVIRRLFSDQQIQAVSDRQLAGFLTHRLFADRERGGQVTHYTITERSDGHLKVFTVVKRGENYLHS